MKHLIIGMGIFAAMGLIMVGCDKSPSSPSSDSTVLLTTSFSKSTGIAGLSKGYSTEAVDSLRIDSAVVVFNRIKFESHVDTVKVDTTGTGNDDVKENEINVTLRGPFVVFVRDTVTIDFASQTIPAGVYDGIKFKIHRLMPNEKFEDSDSRNGRRRFAADSLPYGSSVTVWGKVKKNGVWTSFKFAYDGELEFKVKGNFVVSEATSLATFALKFNMGAWFVDQSGVMLDPTDTTTRTRELIREAIKRSFEQCRGGRDHDHDGRPD